MFPGDPVPWRRLPRRWLLVASVGVALVVGAGVVAADPTASCSLSRTEIHPGEAVTLDASASENATAYRFNDSGTGDWGAWQDSATSRITYTETGTYHPRVQVRSAADFTDIADCGPLSVVPNEPPTASFTYTPTTPAPGESVTFSGTVDDPDGEVVEVMWRVEGETVASGSSMAYTFDTEGDYQVTLVATDDDGRTTTASETITVGENEPPIASFSYSPTDPVPDTSVTFTASASDPDGDVVGYRWRVDGETIGEGPQFEYSFGTTGTYAVTLVVVDDSGATTTVHQTVSVGPANRPPSGSFTWAPAEPTTGQVVTFEAAVSDEAAVDDYEWAVDGDTVGTGPTLEYTFGEPGNHSVVLSVTDDDGATWTLNRTISVTAATPAEPVDVTADWMHSPLYPEAGERLSLIALGPADAGVSYRWDIGDDGSIEQRGITVTYAFSEPGAYEVVLVAVGPDGETRRTTRTVVVHPATENEGGDDPLFWVTPQYPQPGERVTLVVVPPPDATDYAGVGWDLDGDGSIDDRGRVVPYIVPENGTPTVSVVVELPNGTIREQSRRLDSVGDPVDPPDDDDSVLWSIPNNPAPNETVTLLADPPRNASAVSEYRWDLDDDGEYEATGVSVTHTFETVDRMPIRLQIEWANGSTTTVEEIVPVGNATLRESPTAASFPVGATLVAGLLLGVVAALSYWWRYHD